ncbi:hypothetical protein KIPB_005566, partial [Kipferlia bialata]
YVLALDATRKQGLSNDQDRARVTGAASRPDLTLDQLQEVAAVMVSEWQAEIRPQSLASNAGLKLESSAARLNADQERAIKIARTVAHMRRRRKVVGLMMEDDQAWANDPICKSRYRHLITQELIPESAREVKGPAALQAQIEKQREEREREKGRGRGRGDMEQGAVQRHLTMQALAQEEGYNDVADISDSEILERLVLENERRGELQIPTVQEVEAELEAAILAGQEGEEWDDNDGYIPDALGHETDVDDADAARKKEIAEEVEREKQIEGREGVDEESDPDADVIADCGYLIDRSEAISLMAALHAENDAAIAKEEDRHERESMMSVANRDRGQAMPVLASKKDKKKYLYSLHRELDRRGSERPVPRKSSVNTSLPRSLQRNQSMLNPSMTGGSGSGGSGSDVPKGAPRRAFRPKVGLREASRMSLNPRPSPGLQRQKDSVSTMGLMADQVAAIGAGPKPLRRSFSKQELGTDLDTPSDKLRRMRSKTNLRATGMSRQPSGIISQLSVSTEGSSEG